MGWSLGDILKSAFVPVLPPFIPPVLTSSSPKEIVSKIASAGAMAGQVAAPFIAILRDVKDALAPKFEIGIDFQGGVNVGIPTQYDVEFGIRGSPWPASLPYESARAAVSDNSLRPIALGDVTGGFLANLSADRSKLRWARRQLQLMSHIARKGHRLSANDSLNVYARFTPHDLDAFLGSGQGPVFEVDVDESRGEGNQTFHVAFDGHETRRLAIQRLRLEAEVPGNPSKLKGLVNTRAVSAFETLTLRRPSSPSGETKIRIRVRLLNKPDITAASAGILEIGLLRQSAYLKDSLLVSRCELQQGSSFEERSYTYNVALSSGFARPETREEEFEVNYLDRPIRSLIDEAVRLASESEKPETGGTLSPWERALMLNLLVAEKRERLLSAIEALVENLRDIGTGEAFDVRGKAIARVQNVGPDKCSNTQIFIDYGTSPFLLAEVSLLGPRDSVTAFIPTKPAEDAEFRLQSRALSKSSLVSAATPSLFCQVLYGWLDDLEVWRSAVIRASSEVQTDSEEFDAPLEFTTKWDCINYFASEKP